MDKSNLRKVKKGTEDNTKRIKQKSSKASSIKASSEKSTRAKISSTKQSNTKTKAVKSTKAKAETKDSVKHKKFLPIGTVVLLENGSKRLMITGFCVVRANQSDKVWDYCGCVYPEGTIVMNQTFLFDHKQIKKIYHLGLQDDAEEIKFKTQLVTRIKEEKKKFWV